MFAIFGIRYNPINGALLAWDGRRYDGATTLSGSYTFTAELTYTGRCYFNGGIEGQIGAVAPSSAIFTDVAISTLTLSLANGVNIVPSTGSGSKIGTSVSQKIGFWNATPIVQPSGAAQAVPAAYATGVFGLDSDVNMHALYDLVVAMRTALVNAGLMKGSA